MHSATHVVNINGKDVHVCRKHAHASKREAVPYDGVPRLCVICFGKMMFEANQPDVLEVIHACID